MLQTRHPANRSKPTHPSKPNLPSLASETQVPGVFCTRAVLGAKCCQNVVRHVVVMWSKRKPPEKLPNMWFTRHGKKYELNAKSCHHRKQCGTDFCPCQKTWIVFSMLGPLLPSVNGPRFVHTMQITIGETLYYHMWQALCNLSSGTLFHEHRSSNFPLKSWKHTM